MRLTVDVCTKDRYDTLACTLQSLAFQTCTDFDIVIVDDSDNRKDIRELPAFQQILTLFNYYSIGWKVIWGSKRGQHHSHQIVQDEATTEWIFRIDDDEVAEPDVLQKLLSRIAPDVGAIGGLVPQGPLQLAPPEAANLITDLNRPNVQWFKHKRALPIVVDHLHSTFLYRKGVARYELDLSPAAHREETLFTYEIKRKGFKVLVLPTAITWHFRGSGGGIRSHQDINFWEQDERIFHTKLLEWGINTDPCKLVVQDTGKGDHCIVRKLVPELKAKYEKLIFATCYPDVFEDCDVQQISIAEAQQRYGPLDRFNIYKHMIDWNWKGSLEDAYRKLYDI